MHLFSFYSEAKKMLLVTYQYAAAVPKRAEHHTNWISLAPTRSVSKLTLKKKTYSSSHRAALYQGMTLFIFQAFDYAFIEGSHF